MCVVRLAVGMRCSGRRAALRLGRVVFILGEVLCTRRCAGRWDAGWLEGGAVLLGGSLKRLRCAMGFFLRCSVRAAAGSFSEVL